MHAWSARRALPRTFQGQRCAWSPSCCSRITMAHCERNTPRASGYQCFLAWLVAGSATPRCASNELRRCRGDTSCNRRLKKFSFRRKTVKRKEAGAPEREGLVARYTIDHRTRSDSKTPGVGSRDTHGTHGHTDHTDEPHNHPDPPTATHTHDRGADDPRTDRSTEPHGRLPSEPAALCTVTAVDRIAATPDGLFFP